MGDVISLRRLEESVGQSYAVGLGRSGQYENVLSWHKSPGLPHVDSSGRDPSYSAYGTSSAERSDQTVDGGYRFHAPSFLHFVNLVKSVFSRLAWRHWSDKMSFMTKTLASSVMAVPPPGEEHAFARLDYVAMRAGTNPTALSRAVGRPNSSWISAAKQRGTDISPLMLKHIKKKYGVDYDWMIDGDESGLTVNAREFLGLK